MSFVNISDDVGHGDDDDNSGSNNICDNDDYIHSGVVVLFTKQSKYSPKMDLVTFFVWLARSAGDHHYH